MAIQDVLKKHPKGFDIPAGHNPRKNDQLLILCAKKTNEEQPNFEPGTYYLGYTGFSTKHFYRVCTKDELDAAIAEKAESNEEQEYIYGITPITIISWEKDSAGCIPAINFYGRYVVVPAKEVKKSSKPKLISVSQKQALVDFANHQLNTHDDQLTTAKVEHYLSKVEVRGE